MVRAPAMDSLIKVPKNLLYVQMLCVLSSLSKKY